MRHRQLTLGVMLLAMNISPWAIAQKDPARRQTPVDSKTPILVIVATEDVSAESVRQILAQLEKLGVAVEVQTVNVQRRTSGDRLEVHLRLRNDEPHQNVAKLIEELGQLGIEHIGFALAQGDRNAAVVHAGPDVRHSDVTKVTSQLTKQKHIRLDITVRSAEPALEPAEKGVIDPKMFGLAEGAPQRNVPAGVGGPTGSDSISPGGLGGLLGGAGKPNTPGAPAGGPGVGGDKPLSGLGGGAGELGGSGGGLGSGAGGLGGLAGGFAGGEAILENSRYVASDQLIVSWNDERDTAWGFSTLTGEWVKQKLDATMNEPPILSSSIGAIRNKSTIHAFSGKTGQWDTLRLPGGVKLNTSVDDNLVLVNAGNSVYTFAATTGRWTTPDGALLDTDPAQRAYALKNMLATDMAQVIAEAYDSLDVQPIAEMNSIVVRGTPAQLDALATLIRAVDKAAVGSDHEMFGSDGQTQPAPANLVGERGSLPRDTVELERRYHRAEIQAAEVADRMRDGRVGGARDDLKKELRDAVTAAFEARQALQRAELAEFGRRMERVRQSIADRQRIADQIIERRVNDLLNPRIKWDDDRQSANDREQGEDADASGQFAAAPKAMIQTGGVAKHLDQPETGRVTNLQVWLKSPIGAKMRWRNQQLAVLPARLNAESGHSIPFPLSAIPGHEGLELTGHLEFSSSLPLVESFVTHNAIPIEITNEDIEQAASGNMVTKVVYLPDPEFAETALAGIETLVTTRLDPGVDPISEADRRGTILAVLRLGNRTEGH